MFEKYEIQTTEEDREILLHRLFDEAYEDLDYYNMEKYDDARG